jgi:hypothetical protein
MNAVRDVDGEMVATDRITASYVTARFRNVAERGGKVDLEFQVRVPERMLDSKWQLRLDPDMFLLGDSLRLDLGVKSLLVQNHAKTITSSQPINGSIKAEEGFLPALGTLYTFDDENEAFFDYTRNMAAFVA